MSGLLANTSKLAGRSKVLSSGNVVRLHLFGAGALRALYDRPQSRSDETECEQWVNEALAEDYPTAQIEITSVRNLDPKQEEESLREFYRTTAKRY